LLKKKNLFNLLQSNSRSEFSVRGEYIRDAFLPG